MSREYINSIAYEVNRIGKRIRFRPDSLLGGYIGDTNAAPEVMQSIYKRLANNINMEIGFIRGKIMPVYVAATDEFAKLMTEHDPKPKDDVIVNPVRIPEGLADMVASAGGISFKSLTPSLEGLDVGTQGETDINFIRKVIEASAHAELAFSVLGGFEDPNKTLLDIWDNILCAAGGSQYELLFLDPLKNAKTFIIIHTLLEGMLKLKPLATRHKDTATFNGLVRTVLAEVFNVLVYIVKQAEKFDREKVVITSVQTETRENINTKIINVWNSSYEAYLQEGNTPDAILGYSVSIKDNSYVQVTADTLKANQAEYTEAFRKHDSYSKYLTDLNRIKLAKNAYMIVAEKLFTDHITPDIRDFCPNCTLETALEYIKDKINSMDQVKLLNYNPATGDDDILAGLMGVLFENFYVDFIIKETKRFMSEHNMPRQDALSLAFARHIARYVIDQLEAV